MFEQILSTLKPFLPFAISTIVVMAGLSLGHRFLFRSDLASGRSALRRQVTLLALSATGLLMLLLAFPMSEVTRGQILSLLGILLTGVIAFSSTTFVANIMAGLMLRAVKTFHPGDFIRVNEQWGRVTETGLFHTEIQTEDRDLTTFPNLYLATHPVTVVHKSGTIISTALSLGYDVPHARVEELLLNAAHSAKLEDPFVLVNELGDFSVTYKVCGFLPEVKQLLTVKSALRRAVLDSLHGADIEIVSPSYMNQRQLQPGERHIPAVTRAQPTGNSSSAEAIVFDKAEKAEQLAALNAQRSELQKQLTLNEDQRDPAASDQQLEEALAKLDEQLETLQQEISNSNNP